ncbi:MAG: twin-arginine translocation signal domain-containing protein, partial [Deltaproteobacteria bacterium]
MKRRNFLKYLGVGGAGFGLGYVFKQATKPPGAKLIPYVIPPDDVIPGVANWYASRCTQCGAGCGVVVKVLEGRAKKIEGNPLHPISRGKLCARGQAAVQALYNPDRIKGPLKRNGGNGSGSFTEISWEE